MKAQDYKDIKISNVDTVKVMANNKIWWQKNTVPGPSSLIGGNLQAGFYGEVPASEFITGDELARLIGLTAGESQNSNEPWLKFSYLGKTEFIAKKTFRHSISWEDINKADAVYGNKTIKINGNIYKVRLVKGKNEGLQETQSDPDNDCYYSEWNKLMLPIHKNAPSSFEFTLGVKMPTENWNVGYTDFDLWATTETKVGYNSWCQDIGGKYYERVIRGAGSNFQGSDISYGVSYSSSAKWDSFGWRPVLELVD